LKVSYWVGRLAKASVPSKGGWMSGQSAANSPDLWADIPTEHAQEIISHKRL
jgi:hypothetical protein